MSRDDERNGGGPIPRNNRWVEDRDDDRKSGQRWQDRLSSDKEDWTIPLNRNEVLEQELFSQVCAVVQGWHPKSYWVFGFQ